MSGPLVLRGAVALGAAAFAALLWSIARRAASRRGVVLTGTALRTALGAGAVAALVDPDELGAALVHACAWGVALVGARSDRAAGYVFDDTVATALRATFALGALGASLPSVLTGAACAGGALYAVRAATAGRGLGAGDVKLAAALGAGLGPREGMVALGAAFVFGAAYALALLACGHARRGTLVRFAPFLAAGALAAAAQGRYFGGLAA